MSPNDETTLPDRPVLITQTEYGRLKGWSRQYVHQLVRRGRIPLHDGLVDPDEADAALASNSDPGRDRSVRAESVRFPLNDSDEGRAPETGPSRAYAKARTIREHYAAMHERLEYMRAAGELTSVAEVKEAAHFAGATTRTALENSAAKIGQAIAEELKVDSLRATSIAHSEIKAALAEIAHQIDKRMSTYSDALTDDERAIKRKI